MFEGFSEETVRFFLDIRFHNDVMFFKEHESVYEAYVKRPFYTFIDETAPAALQVDPGMEVRPAKCLARIRRDTRFTKDKSPFRDHLWLLFRHADEPRENSVMYWFELSPENVNWGLGFWGMNRPAMNALRRKMLANSAEVRRALKKSGVPDKTLLISGEKYARMLPPPDLPEDMAALYPHKSIYIERVGTPFAKCYTPEITTMFAADMLRLKPMYELLRSAADEGMAALDK